MLKRFFLMMTALFLSADVMAYHRAASGSYGDIANNIMGPIGGITYLVQTAAIMCGVGLIVGSVFKYKAYRRNPVAVTVGAPFVMLLTGLGCVILGFLHYNSI